MLVLDKNDMSGNDDPVCGDNRPGGLSFFVADCDEMECKCCSKCCKDSEERCNDLELTANFDDTYSREKYVFSEDIKFDAHFRPGN